MKFSLLANLSLLSLDIQPTHAFSIQRQSPLVVRTAYADANNAYFQEQENKDDGENRDPVELLETLSRDCIMPSLARLACAFAPPGHALHPKDLQYASVLSVDDQHIEISAILCEAEGCINVAVPVNFPHSCLDSPDMEECVLENIEVLDQEAHSRIQQTEWKDGNAEQIQADERLVLELQEEPFPSSDLPSWWTYAEFHGVNAYLGDECKSVKNLLNEDDFSSEIQSLAEQQVVLFYKEDNLDVRKAAVAAVGTSGILIRAQLRQLDLEGQVDRTTIVDLPITFGQEVTSVEGLRASVLGLVATVAAE